MRIRIKFCGITRAADAEAAVALGVDALGFVLVPASARFCAATRAAAMRRRLPPFVSCVALFKDPDSSLVQDAIDALRPDLLQFHGREDAAFCASFGLPYMKALPMGEPQDLARAARRFRGAAALLLDSHAGGALGGSGRSFDWKRARGAGQRLDLPLVLAGGLKADNVEAAIGMVHPFAVDVSSGIESKPGVKDARKMKAFVNAVRRAEARKKR